MDIELTSAEKEMITIRREEEHLRKEKKKIEFEHAHDKLLNNILRAENKGKEQVRAAQEFLKVIIKISEGWSIEIEDTTKEFYVYGEYIDSGHKDGNYEKEIIFTETQKTEDATLYNKLGYKIIVEEHIINNSSMSFRVTYKNNGWKMRLTGEGLEYKEEQRFLKSPKTIIKNMNDVIERLENKKKNIEKSKNAHSDAFIKYNKEFPTATIVKDSEWEYNKFERTHSGKSINVIKITFANGIKVKYKVYDDGSLSRKELIFPGKDPISFMRNLNTMSVTEE